MMNVEQQIQGYIVSLQNQKRVDMMELHSHIQQVMPNCRLWYLDGKDELGKVVTNPNIGYGHQTLHYANGTTKEFYQIGISANTSGISVYLMGIRDKLYLKQTYAATIGKASITGYCIKFKTIKDIDLGVLMLAIQDNNSTLH